VCASVLFGPASQRCWGLRWHPPGPWPATSRRPTGPSRQIHQRALPSRWRHSTLCLWAIGRKRPVQPKVRWWVLVAADCGGTRESRVPRFRMGYQFVSCRWLPDTGSKLWRSISRKDAEGRRVTPVPYGPSLASVRRCSSGLWSTYSLYCNPGSIRFGSQTHFCPTTLSIRAELGFLLGMYSQ